MAPEVGEALTHSHSLASYAQEVYQLREAVGWS